MNEELFDNEKKLIFEFYLIHCRGWIKSQGKGTSAAGATFEYLLGKKEDTKSLPDYYGIELKTKLSTSTYPIRLFSVVPDNRPGVLNELYDNCSWSKPGYKDLKVLQAIINTTSYSNNHRRYAFKLHVNREKKRVELLVRNNWDNYYVTNDISWSFDELELRLTIKLSSLAIIHAQKETVKETKIEYFKYNTMDLYRLKSFDNFLNLLESGKIFVELKMYPYTEGELKGQFRNRETTFNINEADIPLLFDKVEANIKDIVKNIQNW